MSTIIVAIIGSVTALATILLQAKVHRDNRSDHGSTTDAIAELRADVLDVKADVRAVKADVRDVADRMDRVERAAGTPT